MEKVVIASVDYEGKVLKLANQLLANKIDNGNYYAIQLVSNETKGRIAAELLHNMYAFLYLAYAAQTLD